MTDQKYHLTHANITHALASLDDPCMADFVTLAAEINTLTQHACGFISQPDLPDAGTVYQFPLLLNLSIWDSLADLEKFVYASSHMQAFDQRRRWFKPMTGPNYVLYWQPVNKTPTEREVQERLSYLDQHSPTPYASPSNRHSPSKICSRIL